MSATPAQRHVDLEAAPLPDVLRELMTRPAKNSQVIGDPDVHSPNRVPEIEAAPGSPVVDIATIGPHRRP